MRTPGGLTLRMVALAATLGLASSPSPADPVAPSARPKFGTNVATSTVSAYDFSPIDSTTLFDHPVIQGDFLLATATPYGAVLCDTGASAGSAPRGNERRVLQRQPAGRR